MGISSVNLMGSSVIINVPSSSSSSSPSSSSSSRVHQTGENEGDDRVCTGVDEAKLSDRNRPCRKLGQKHEVPRSILENLENDESLMSLKRGIGDFNEGENQLKLEIEQLEREVLMLMLAKGLKVDKLGNFVDEKGFEVLKAMKLDDKLKDLGIGIEEPKKCEQDKVLETDLAKQKQQLACVVDECINESEKKLCEEIELLESMLERGSNGLLDLQMMMEEVKGLKGSEKMVSEIKTKMSELESELCELSNSIVELKGKKSKELMMGCVKEVEDMEQKCDEHLEDDDIEEEEDNTSKIKWGPIVASVGGVAVAAAAVIFMGQTRVVVKSERRNKGQNG